MKQTGQKIIFQFPFLQIVFFSFVFRSVSEESPLPIKPPTVQPTKLSRTSSTSSSGVTSMASSSSCESSASSVCDSPPPASSPNAILSRKDEEIVQQVDKVERPVEVEQECETKSTEKTSEHSAVQESSQNSESGSQNQVVLRKGKSSEAQRRALATRRRLVQSMIVESSSGMSSLCSPSPSPPSPAIEKENPFREAMMKFAAMEAEDAEKMSAKKKVNKVFSTKSTETLVPTRDSKSTQTIPSFVARNPVRQEDGGAFRTCLRTQLSCPATNGNGNGVSSSGTRPRAPSTGPLSYTSTPRPYTSQSMTALNRSMTNIPNNNPISPPLVQVRQEQQRQLPTSAHRRPLSMLVSQNDIPDYRGQRLQPQHQLPAPNYTPPMHQQPHQGYSPQLNSPLWSPNSSLYLTPMGNGSPSSGYGSSVYSTPVGSSPCRNSRYSGTPIVQTSSNNNSPIRYRPISGFHHHHHPDRLQLHIEGQSSLV